MTNSVLPRAMPFALFIAFIALGGVLESVAAAVGFDPRWWYGVRAVAAAGLLIWFWRDYQELRAIPTRKWHWLLGIAVGVAVFVLWINLTAKWLVLGKSAGFDPRSDGAVAWEWVVMRVLGAALVVPVMEELFWRSFVMRWVQDARFLEVDPAAVRFNGLLISSVIFGAEHHLWFAGLCAGFAYGWLYILSANLWIAIAAHAVTNGLLAAWVLQTGHWQFW